MDQRNRGASRQAGGAAAFAAAAAERKAAAALAATERAASRAQVARTIEAASQRAVKVANAARDAKLKEAIDADRREDRFASVVKKILANCGSGGMRSSALSQRVKNAGGTYSGTFWKQVSAVTGVHCEDAGSGDPLFIFVGTPTGVPARELPPFVARPKRVLTKEDKEEIAAALASEYGER